MKPFLRMLLMCSFFSLLQGCERVSITPDTRVLTEKIETSHQWKIITPNPPLKACKKIQSISIQVADISQWNIDSKNNQFITPAGKKIQLEIKLFDEVNNEYVFNEFMLGAGGIGLSYLPEDTKKGIGLPHDVNFTSVNIRSSATIKGKEVTWRCIENY